MPTMLEMLRAVRNSDLPPLTRLVVSTLVGLSDPDTCEIPNRFMPSLSDLAKFTGMSRSTVAVHLNSAEECGWVKRDKPDVHRAWRDGERTRYFVQIPTSPGAGLVRYADQSGSRTSPGAGTDLVREPDSPSPGAGHAYEPSNHTNQQLSQAELDTQQAKKPKRARTPEPIREDTEELCNLLANLIEQNGTPRPAITDTWRRECRLLLDDKRRTPRLTAEKVKALVTWSQQDTFWKAHITSMTAFRKKYDTLRLQALKDWDTQQKHQPHQNNTGSDAYTSIRNRKQSWQED